MALHHLAPDSMRRALLAAGLAWPFAASRAAGDRVDARTADRILVVLEMSGGNDGFNTVVPYADDTYYRLRPRSGRMPMRGDRKSVV